MNCKRCGKEIPDKSKFCTFCGAETDDERMEQMKEEKATTQEVPKTEASQEAEEKGTDFLQKKNWLPVMAIAVVFTIVIVAGGIFVYMGNSGKESKNQQTYTENNVSQTTREVNEKSDDTTQPTTEPTPEPTPEPTQVVQLSLKEQIQKLNQTENALDTIDVYAENYNDRIRQAEQSEYWDSTLFEMLEDTKKDTDEDGLIDNYNIEKRKLVCEESGNIIEYDIYKHPDTKKINKIVSIEHQGNMLEIIDYYYTDDEKISMIFVRKDSSYTPDYATGGKNGERFYFSNDAMTKWRIVQDGDVERNIKDRKNYVTTKGEIKEAKKSPGSNKYIKLVNKCSKEIQQQYADNEVKMLNAAYNTYNIAANAQVVNQITGHVLDVSDGGFKGATVCLYLKNSDECVYKTTTDKDGKYEIYIPYALEDSFYVEVSNDGYVPVVIHNISSNLQTSVLAQKNIYLIEESEEKYTFSFYVYDACEKISEEKGMKTIAYATLNIRNGINNREDEAEVTIDTDEHGSAKLELSPGMYTVELQGDYYESSFSTIAVGENKKSANIYSSPELSDGDMRIVLTWGNSPKDLDSHLFTPNDATETSENNEEIENPYHIWFMHMENTNAELDVDAQEGFGPETITIENVKKGTYKYYVADYTNCSNGNFDGMEMSDSEAEVHVFTSDGQTETFYVPNDRKGVIWEVFEIRNGVISPINRYYNSVEDKPWWELDK